MNGKFPSATFWRGKRVFLTGHTGFKGSWLALWLQSLSAEVMGYSLSPPTTPNLFSLAEVELGMKSIAGDVRDLDALHQAMSSFQPEVVLHLAAQPLVRQSMVSPVETYATNIMGTVNLLEAARLINSIRSVVVVTTDKCYENNEKANGYEEQDHLGGNDPYSSSKACAEIITAAYRRSYFSQDGFCHKGVATVRSGNVIGGGDFAVDRLVPDVIRACMMNEDLLLRYPQAVRPWQHVLDPLRGYLLLAERLYQSPSDYSDAWNFGPAITEAKTVGWMADYLCRSWGARVNVRFTEKSLPETQQLLLNSSKANKALQWQPVWSIERALGETVEWYLAMVRQQDMRAYTLSNIIRYMAQT